MRFEAVTIKDIAKALGLSTSTVSRALRDSYEISPETKKLVLEYAEKINYHPELRWKNLLLLAFGQKKMFRNPLVAVLHFFVYAGFIIINIEVLEIVLDGLLGTHRLFAPVLGGFYTFLINAFEVLAVLVLFRSRKK